MEQSPEYTLEDLLENIKEIFPESDEAFIYQWHHPELNLDYIGSHAGTTDDGYTGSGTGFLKQLESNPIEEWERTILTYCSKKDRYNVEQLFLMFYDAANNPKFLNRTNVADGFGTGEDNISYDKDAPYHGLHGKKHKEWLNSRTSEQERRYREKKKEYYQENREKIRSQYKEHYQQNREKIRSQQKEYYEKNKEKKKEYHEENKEKIRSYKKEYYQENKERLSSYIKEYYQENIEERRSQQKEYYEKLTPEQKRRITDTKRIRRQTIRRIIEMDNTYTKDYFKGMKHDEVLKIEEEVKKNIENNKNTLEKFWE